MRRTLSETDFILAAFIFCASLIVSVYAYANIREIERPSTALVSNLRKGAQSYIVMLNGECPGSIDVAVAHDSVWVIKSQGQLRVSYGKVQADVHMQTAAFFNPLGQLNNARLDIQADDYRATITLTNPHPITIDIEAGGADRPEFRQQFTVPGPFTIQRNSDDSYRIDYAYYAITQNPSVKALEGFLARELKVKVVEKESAPMGCGEQQDSRLNLLPLVMKSSAMIGPIYTLMNTGEFKGR